MAPKHPPVNLTRERIAALTLPPGKSELRVPDNDARGLFVRLRADTDRRVWAIRFPNDRWLTIGDVSKIEPKDARKIARRRFAEFELGGDPVAAKAEARTRAKLTMGMVADNYLDAVGATLRASTVKAAKRYFDVHWRPLRALPIHKIARRNVAARLGEIKKEAGVAAAARARANLSALFGWAMREGLLEANPVIGTNDPAAELHPRERALSDGDIRVIWRTCGDDDFGRIVKLLLLTGCRRDEIMRLRWSEVDLDTGKLSIPKERVKNRRALQLPLPPLAVEILKSAPLRHDREYVFGFWGKGFGGSTWYKLALDKRIADGGQKIAPWRLHDLRRTVRTGLGSLGVRPHVAELVLNHVGHKAGIGGVYDQHDYQTEIATALALWADHVRSLVECGEPTVVPLRPVA
jgi:integrase